MKANRHFEKLRRTTTKKGRRAGRPFSAGCAEVGSGALGGLGGGGFFGHHHFFFALDIVEPAFFLNFFVQLFAHKCLYIDRVMRFRYATMKVYPFRFNIYLALIAVALFSAGCKTKSADEKKVSALRIHIESNVDPNGTSQTISLLRADPVSITINHTPILTEDDVVAARVLDTPAGFSVELKFSDTGTITLEQYSASNPDRHFIIFGQWGEKGTEGRWLAAPLITHRIINGILSFTPDMSRDDAYRFVLGLNNVAKANAKATMK
jgi:hypothetical protein